MKTWPARFVVVDEDGPLRTFWTRNEAVTWACGREGCEVVVLPPKRSELPPVEPAVF